MDISPEEYRDFAKSLKFQQVILVYGCTMRGSEVPQNFDVSLNIKETNPQVLGEGKDELQISFSIEVMPESEKQQLLPWTTSEMENLKGFQVVAGFISKYKSNKPIECDAETLLHFSRTSGLLHIWPFAREYVATQTLRMGITPFWIPLLILPPVTGE